MSDLERQIWDLIGLHGKRRSDIERELPRCSRDVIALKVQAMKKRELLVETCGVVARRSGATYAPSPGAPAQPMKPPPAERSLQDVYHAGADEIFRPALKSVNIGELAQSDPARINDNEEPTPSLKARPEEDPVSIKTKRCPQCAKEKPVSAFGKHQRRCEQCLAAADAPVAKAKKASTRKAPARRSSPAKPSNGQQSVRQNAFRLLCGREVDVDVVRDTDGVHRLEFRGAYPGKDPDQFLTLSRDQAIALHGFLGTLVAG